jgi:hypothetical protein
MVTAPFLPWIVPWVLGPGDLSACIRAEDAHVSDCGSEVGAVSRPRARLDEVIEAGCECLTWADAYDQAT